MSRPKIVVTYDKVQVIHSTAGPQGVAGPQGEQGEQGPAGMDAELPSDWTSPPNLTVYFENGLV